jgi:hypothetical protein
MKEIDFHLTNILIKGGVNIKERKKRKQHVPMLEWKKQGCTSYGTRSFEF